MGEITRIAEEVLQGHKIVKVFGGQKYENDRFENAKGPDKDPVARIATIEAAGRAKMPFTTGILVGIGETSAEVVDSLLVLDALAAESGSIQEIIIQNFRPKADTLMRHDAEPSVRYFATVVAASLIA